VQANTNVLPLHKKQDVLTAQDLAQKIIQFCVFE